jgi:hypothetical protein
MDRIQINADQGKWQILYSCMLALGASLTKDQGVLFLCASIIGNGS